MSSFSRHLSASGSRCVFVLGRVTMRESQGLLLLALCLNLHTCRALPNLQSERRSESPGRGPPSEPLLDEARVAAGLQNGTGPVCGPCKKELCPENRGCRAGLVLDSCGCCMECGNLEGQACDPGERSVYYGLCGTGLQCRAGQGAGGAGGEGGAVEDEDEPVCVCEQHEAVCGSDGVTYMNLCQFREAAFSKPGLRTVGEGPCKTGRSRDCRWPHSPAACHAIHLSVCLLGWQLSGSRGTHTCVFTCLAAHTQHVCLTVTCLWTSSHKENALLMSISWI